MTRPDDFMSDLSEENRVLRQRIEQLERALHDDGVDPLTRVFGEHAASYMNVITPEGRSLATGRTSERFGSVIGRSVFEFVEPQYHSQMRDVYARVSASGRSESYEAVGFSETGEPGHTYLTKVVPLKDGATVTSLLLVATDITERVRLERSLTEQEQALRLALEATGIGLWRWDVVNNVITWNDRLREIYGVQQTPRDYAAYQALVHPDDRSLVDSTVQQALATGVYRTFEHRIAARSGFQERWLLAVGSVRHDANGQPAVVVGGAVDITEQKQVAMQLHRAERVESIGQLTAGIAHNFNNLLAVILPNLELAKHGADQAQGVYLQAALDASLQARDLIRNLIALARRDDARANAPAHPADVVRRVEALCRVTFPREITLRLTVTPDIGHVAMSVGDLEQTLLNLLFNARDAVETSTTGRREIRVLVDRIVNEAEAAPWARLRVEDSGCGMSAEVRARVFEPFFTTKPPHKGSGLGLANVVQRVRHAHGTIECESTLGVGSAFTVLLPLQGQAQDAQPPERTEESALPQAVVLLVDDEPLVRNVVRQLLERDRCSVFEAESAAEARSILSRSKVDLVIVDQSMPDETGTESLPSLRALTEAPIVLFTGMAPEAPEGFAALLEKPARRADLQRVLRVLLAPPR